MAAYLVYLATASLSLPPLSLSLSHTPLPCSSGEADEPVARSPVSCRFRPYAVRVLSRRARTFRCAHDPVRKTRRKTARRRAYVPVCACVRARACVCVCVCVTCVCLCVCARARDRKKSRRSAAISRRDQVRVLSPRVIASTLSDVFSDRFADRSGASIRDSANQAGGNCALMLES
jgi:hypothetical protein